MRPEARGALAGTKEVAVVVGNKAMANVRVEPSVVVKPAALRKLYRNEQ